MKSAVSTVLIVALFIPTLAMAELGSDKVAYIGGTTKDKVFPTVKKDVKGRLNTGDDQALMFIPDKKKLSVYTIPYSKIIAIEYGQAVNQFVRLKIHQHYITIGYMDNNDQAQVAIFELGKDVARTILPILIVRTGIGITYQDEEAKKLAGVK